MQRLKRAVIILCFVLSASGTGAGQAGFRIICDEWPPYQILRGNRITGFSTEIVKRVFHRMKVSKFTLAVYPWKRAIIMMEKGECDALFSVNYTQGREAFARYPRETIVDSPWVVWVREGDGLTLQSWRDLGGKTVGLVRGYSYTPEFREFMETSAFPEEAETGAVLSTDLQRKFFFPALGLESGTHPTGLKEK